MTAGFFFVLHAAKKYQTAVKSRACKFYLCSDYPKTFFVENDMEKETTKMIALCFIKLNISFSSFVLCSLSLKHAY